MTDVFIFESNLYDEENKMRGCTQFTLSNGYRSFLGGIEFLENNCGGNFIAGIFDRNDAAVIELTRCPNPLDIRIYTQDEEGMVSFSSDKTQILNLERKLDMKNGIVCISCTLESENGKQLYIESEKYISIGEKHLWATRYLLTPLNFSGQLIIENLIDGEVKNSSEFSFTSTEHFDNFNIYDLNDSICMISNTKDKLIQVCETCGLVFKTGQSIKKRRMVKIFNRKICEFITINAAEKNKIEFQKLGVTATSRDGIAEGLMSFCKRKYERFSNTGYSNEFILSKKLWNDRWQKMDVKIEGDEKAQLAIRFNLFHLVSCANIWDDRVSIAAKGLHGEGYKGHIFWDTEIYMLPFFIYTNPEIAKQLLMYRYNTLEGARENAKRKNYEGAMYAWESAVTGEETTPEWGINYKGEKERIWTGEEEVHISCDIFYGIWNYWRATEDLDFMMDYGMEMILDTCRFMANRLEYDEQNDAYTISNVMGPDEFHPHVSNNFYTNYLFKWCLKKAGELYENFKYKKQEKLFNILEKMVIGEKEITTWGKTAEKILITKSSDGRIIEQFEGYFKLEDPKITQLNESGMPEWPKSLDLSKIHETQLVKQADVLMAMYLLPEEFSIDELIDNFEYYESRTMHKSSLSPCIYSILGMAVDKHEHAYDYFMKTVLTDIEDNQGNTRDGLHAASTGGAWLSIASGFGRFYADSSDLLNFQPWIPEKWKSLEYSINWKGKRIGVRITHDSVTFSTEEDMKVKLFGREYSLEKARNNEIKVNI